MIEKKGMRTWGKSLMIFSFVVWVIDSLTHLLSTLIGRMVCGDEYMCPVDGIVCDKSCGFDTDMHLSLALLILMLLGAVLYHRSQKGIFPIDIKNAEANE